MAEELRRLRDSLGGGEGAMATQPMKPGECNTSGVGRRAAMVVLLLMIAALGVHVHQQRQTTSSRMADEEDPLFQPF